MSNESVSKKVTSGAGRPRVAMIAAVAANGVIGAGNRMPWHLPEDLRHFKAATLGHPVIMGRKTWESIGRPLPGRRNVVVSRQRDLQLQGAQLAASLHDALARCADVDEVFVIGGGELYREALPLASRIVLTEIAQAFDGDTRFPALDPGAWRETTRQAQTSAEGLRFDFVEYERR
ncbi:MAG: dihydrofolate reductase [Betaproteobacteria bacterium]|nr:dihydrofolate reductase [Betaproteobacteria bacterium]